MPSKFLDLTAFVPEPLEFAVTLNGQPRKLVINDPTLTHVVVSEKMKEEMEEFEKKNRTNPKKTAEFIIKKTHALLAIDNEITEDEVRQLGFVVLSKIQVAVSEVIEKAFLAESSQGQPESPSATASQENNTQSPESVSSSPELSNTTEAASPTTK